jgi:hypothetical protein
VLGRMTTAAAAAAVATAMVLVVVVVEGEPGNQEAVLGGRLRRSGL